MNLNPNWNTNRDPQTEILAGWGDARLVRKLDGQFMLIGGNAADRAEARDWLTRFMPDLAPSLFPDSANAARRASHVAADRPDPL